MFSVDPTGWYRAYLNSSPPFFNSFSEFRCLAKFIFTGYFFKLPIEGSNSDDAFERAFESNFVKSLFSLSMKVLILAFFWLAR